MAAACGFIKPPFFARPLLFQCLAVNGSAVFSKGIVERKK